MTAKAKTATAMVSTVREAIGGVPTAPGAGVWLGRLRGVAAAASNPLDQPDETDEHEQFA